MAETFTGTIYKPQTNQPWVGASVTIKAVNDFADGLIGYPSSGLVLTTDSNGQFSTSLSVPASGSATYHVILPNGEAYAFYMAAGGGPLTLAQVIAGAGSVAIPTDSNAALIATKQDKDNDAVDDNIGIFADGQTVDSGFSIGDLGGTPTAESVTFDPAGNIAATDVQAAIEELDTEKSGTAHNHSGTYDPAGSAATVQSNLDDHEGDQENPHQVAAAQLGLVIGTHVQAHDTDLDAIAGLSPTNDDVIQRKAGAWINRTMAQLKTDLAIQQTIIIACSDETTALTAGTAKVTFRMPYAMTLTDVRASVKTAPTGSGIIVNIKEAGTTIFSTKSTIAAGSKTSVGGTPAVISDSALADDAEMTVDIDQVGSTIAGAGLKMVLIGTKV